jgi:hypothetical protein
MAILAVYEFYSVTELTDMMFMMALEIGMD